MTETFEWYAPAGWLELEDGEKVFVALGDLLEGYETSLGPVFTAVLSQTSH